MTESPAQGDGEIRVSGGDGGAPAQPPVMRESLPIPDFRHVGLTTYDAKDPNTKYPPITMLRPPAGAPNVLIVLLDDVGFAASSAFGGPCNTQVAERLAAFGTVEVSGLSRVPSPPTRIRACTVPPVSCRECAGPARCYRPMPS